ncbi:protein RETICULATA-RELATED 4, chloroplastic [Selaginella moellendorffii]|nr:protein RETICULATA-RELATED 4, chloroplastic [Selaginella moellendorffii]|eukprot:XP_002960279.2 protein RETICULATA-RELATED 4, chloroplastic [Selaginella moellendorffii]
MALCIPAAASSSQSSYGVASSQHQQQQQRLVIFSQRQRVDLRHARSKTPKLVFAAAASSGLFAARMAGPRSRFVPRQASASMELDDGSSGGGGNGSTGGYGGGSGGGDDGSSSDKNRTEALLALASLGRSLDNIPRDLAYAIQDGRVTAAIVERFVLLEKTPLRGWLLQFSGFMERLLADDLFLTKVFIECGVGIFTKTAAELERRKENFSKELDFVFADIVMALIADFMLVWLPAPTVSLRAAPAMEAGKLAKFFYGCPDNAFQVAIRGTSYSLLQRMGAIGRNGAKLLGVGVTASLVGTAVTNGLISVRKSLDKNFAGEAEDVPIFSTSLAYGVYMAVSSNLRYQILAGVVEQRILEPMLHNKKLALSVLCFAVRTGNTFLGSLMWVDYARWVGVQKIRE